MIGIISGTNRPKSNTRKVAAHIESIYRKLGVTHQLLDLACLPPEIFAPTSYAEKPAEFARFTDVVRAAGLLGGLRPVDQLQSIFGYRNAFIHPERVFMPGIGKLLNESGQFTDQEISSRLEKQAAGFVEFVEKLRGKKLR